MSSPDFPRRSLFAVWRWPRWTWGIAAVFLIFAAYPLSYAPCERLQKELAMRRRWSLPPAYFEIYRPIDWLFDNTPLQHPLLQWAAWWGVEMEFVISSAIRTDQFNTTIDNTLIQSATDPPE